MVRRTDGHTDRRTDGHDDSNSLQPKCWLRAKKLVNDLLGDNTKFAIKNEFHGFNVSKLNLND